jgi:hypothetical protein
MLVLEEVAENPNALSPSTSTRELRRKRKKPMLLKREETTEVVTILFLLMILNPHLARQLLLLPSRDSSSIRDSRLY